MSRRTVARWVAALAAPLVLLLGSAPAGAAEERGTEPKSGTGTATERDPARLVEVRVASHDTYDRVVFEYADGTPDYEVAYGPVEAPGSGQPVELRGDQPLEVIMRNSMGVRGGPLEGTTTNWTFQLPSVVQVNHLGSFEGVGKAGIGIATKSPVGFRVFTLSNPGRLVIDVAHAGTTRPTGNTTTAPPQGDPRPTRSDDQQAAAPTDRTGEGDVIPGGSAPPGSSTPPDGTASPDSSATPGGSVPPGGGLASGGGAAAGEPAAWRLGLIGGIALASLTAAGFVIRKLRTG